MDKQEMEKDMTAIIDALGDAKEFMARAARIIRDEKDAKSFLLIMEMLSFSQRQAESLDTVEKLFKSAQRGE